MVKRSSPGCSAPSARCASGSTSSKRPCRAAHSAAALPAQATAWSSADGDASTSRAISTARPTLPAFIAKVALSASRVTRGPRIGDPVADGPQKRGGPLRLAEHEELVGRPQQRPGDQLRLGSTPSGSAAASTASGFAAAALKRHGLGQRQPRRQPTGALQRRAGQPLGQREVAQPQRLLRAVDDLIHRLRGVAVHRQRGQPQSVAEVRWLRAAA